MLTYVAAVAVVHQPWTTAHQNKNQRQLTCVAAMTAVPRKLTTTTRTNQNKERLLTYVAAMAAVPKP